MLFCSISGTKLLAQDTLNISATQIASTILQKIDSEISLTENQKEKVLALLTERSRQIETLKARENPKQFSKESLFNINQAAYNQIKMILTEEQFVRLQEIRKATKKQKEKYPEEQVYLSDQDLELDF